VRRRENADRHVVYLRADKASRSSPVQ